MLILGRDLGEKVNIYDKDRNLLAQIIVHAVRGKTIKLGFQAPPEVLILRDEIDKENVNG